MDERENTAGASAAGVSVEALLAQREWVARIARSLVGDASTADDLVQQAWVRYLRRPPERAGALRAWLRTVLRNEVRQLWRSGARRHAREAQREPPRAVPRPDEVVQRAEDQRRVAAAVLDLDEPYRTTLLLHFYEGLATSEIAARTNVPVETVRTRTKRALARLRAKLDARHGGDGAAWALALLPLASWTRADASAALTAQGTSTAAIVAGGGVAVAATKQTVAITAVLALLCGVAGTLGVQALARGPAEEHETPPVAVADGVARSSGAPSPRRRTHDGPPAHGTPAASSPAAASAARERTPGDAPVPDAGTNAIWGVVRTEQGEPIPGVAVRALLPWKSARTSESWSWYGDAPPDPAAAEERVRDAGERVRFEEANARWATTGPDGTYRIDGLGSEARVMQAWKEGHRFEPLERRGGWSVWPGNRWDFLGTALAGLEVDVVAADGSPVGEATVILAHPQSGGTGEVPWSRAAPLLWTEPGERLARAVAGRAGERSSPAVPVTLVAGERTAVRLELASRLGVRGRVVLPEGGRFERGTVTLRRAGSSGATGPAAQPLRSEYLYPRRGHAFEFLDLEPGAYEIGLRIGSDEAEAVTIAALVRDRIVQHDLRVPEPTPERFLAVRAEDPDGNALPVEAADINLRIGSSSNGFRAEGLRGEDGTLWVPRRRRGLDLDEVDECRVTVTTPEYGAQSVVLSSRNREAIVVRFAAPGRLEVVAPPGAPDALVEALRLAILKKGGGVNVGFEPRQPGQRQWRSGPLQPAEYTVSVVLDSVWDPPQIHAFDVEVGRGPRQVTLWLPTLRRVTLRIPTSPRGTSVHLRGADRNSHLHFQGEPDASGAVVFPFVPEGEYTVAIGDDRRQAEQVVVSGADVDLTLPR